jgi:hypothetical protein
MKSENIGKRTASVFPLPVGAIKRTFFPANIGGKAKTCGSVGSENPNSANASRTGLASESKTLEPNDPGIVAFR